MIARIGVFTRYYLVPGDYNARYVVSLVFAVPCIYILNRMTRGLGKPMADKSTD